jgi:hypothetical protein
VEKIMESIELDNDDAPNISFEGELIGSGSTRDNNRDATRWTVYKIYRTKGGKLIGQAIGYSQWDGETTRYSCRACSTEAELKAFIGFSDAAKEAYEEAGIDASIQVD